MEHPQNDHTYVLSVDSKKSVIQTTDSSTVNDLTLQRPCELKLSMHDGYVTSVLYNGHNPERVLKLLEQQKQKRNMDLALNIGAIALVFMLFYCGFSIVANTLNSQEKVNYVN